MSSVSSLTRVVALVAVAVVAVGAVRTHVRVHDDVDVVDAATATAAAAAAATSAPGTSPLLAACPHYASGPYYEPFNASAGDAFGCESFSPPDDGNDRVYLQWTIGAERPGRLLMASITALAFDASVHVDLLTVSDWRQLNVTRVHEQLAEDGVAVVALGFTPVHFVLMASAASLSSSFVAHTFEAEARTNRGPQTLALSAAHSPRANHTAMMLPNLYTPLDTIVTIAAPRASAGAAVFVGVDRVALPADYDFLWPIVDGAVRVNITALLDADERYSGKNLWGRMLVFGLAAELFADADADAAAAAAAADSVDSRAPTIDVSQLPRSDIVSSTPPSLLGGQLFLPALGDNVTFNGGGRAALSNIGQSFFAVCAPSSSSCARVRVSAARNVGSCCFPTVAVSADRFPLTFYAKNNAELNPSKVGVVDVSVELPFEPSSALSYHGETQCQAWWWTVNAISSVSIVVECVGE